jgi:formate-dependent nitrite reductase membrane component NrfD
MNTFVADPEWGWWIIGYFYLGGIAAGAYFMATLIDLAGRPEDRPLARVGYLIALPLIMLCGIFLILDLHRPERFWHMLVRSEVVHQALDEGWPWSGGWDTMLSAPLMKYWSPMSVGSWALSLFGLCSALSVLGSMWPAGRLSWLLRQSALGKVIAVVGCCVGFFVASYTGALLTATNQPVWSESVWIAPLFLTSAASTGVALMLLLGRWQKLPGPSLERLERVDLWVLGLELAFFVLFLASIGSQLVTVLKTVHGLVLVWGTLLLGLLAPLAVHLRLFSGGRGMQELGGGLGAAAVLALVGGFFLRFGILTTPPALLADQPAVSAGFGPEDGRPRGGGMGADPGNRVGEVKPPSKLRGTR